MEKITNLEDDGSVTIEQISCAFGGGREIIRLPLSVLVHLWNPARGECDFLTRFWQMTRRCDAYREEINASAYRRAINQR